MSKIILASLIAISFSAFANEHESTGATTPPAAEGTTPAATDAAGAAKTAKKEMKKDKHGKHAMKGKKEEKKEEAAH